MPSAGNDQRPGGERGPQPAAEDRHHEGVEDPERRARQPRQRRQPEQLVGGVGEADRGQLGHHHRPHHPHGEREQQRGDGDEQVAAGDGAALRLPELLVLGPPVLDQMRAQHADVLGLVDLLHLRQLGELLELLAVDALLHGADGQVHPHQREARDGEQRHEAALPDAGEVVEQAEQDRQHEAAEAADQADHAADRADVVGVVDGDVLVDRRLAEAHEEAEHEHDHREGEQPGLEPERHGPADALHDVLGGRIGQQEAGGDRHAERPVHHAARAVLVGEHAAVDAEQAGRHRVGGADHAGGGDVEAVDADQIARQPQRQRHERAEHEEVVEREAPHLDVLQGLQHGAAAAPAWRRSCGGPASCGSSSRHEPEHDGHHGDGDGPDVGDRLPAVGDHDEGGDELGDGGADVAGAEDAERGALALLRIPLGDVGDADRERAAGDADAERGQQERRIVVGEGEQPGRHRRRQHHGRVDDAAAVLVGPDAEHQADQRAGQDRRADQQAELRVVEPQVILDLHADDGKDRPHRKADREGDRGEPQRPSLVAAPYSCQVVHGSLPVSKRRRFRRRREVFDQSCASSLT